MRNINICLPKVIEDWIREKAIIYDDDDLEFAIISLLSGMKVKEDLKKRGLLYEESEQ